MNPICWLLTVDSEMASSFSVHLLRICLFSSKTLAIQEIINCLTGEFDTPVNFAGKTDIALMPSPIHAISVFRVKFTLEFTS